VSDVEEVRVYVILRSAVRGRGLVMCLKFDNEDCTTDSYVVALATRVAMLCRTFLAFVGIC